MIGEYKDEESNPALTERQKQLQAKLEELTLDSTYFNLPSIRASYWQPPAVDGQGDEVDATGNYAWQLKKLDLADRLFH